MDRIKRIVGLPVHSGRTRWSWLALGAAALLGIVSAASAGPGDTTEEADSAAIEAEPTAPHGVIVLQRAEDCGEDCEDLHAHLSALGEHVVGFVTGEEVGAHELELPENAHVIRIRRDHDLPDEDLSWVHDALSQHGLDLHQLLEHVRSVDPDDQDLSQADRERLHRVLQHLTVVAGEEEAEAD